MIIIIIIIIICYILNCLQRAEHCTNFSNKAALSTFEYVFFCAHVETFYGSTHMLMGKTMTSAKIRLFVGDWKPLVPTKKVKAWLHPAKLVGSNSQLKCSAKQSNHNHRLNITTFRIKSANTDKENADRRTIIFKVFICPPFFSCN